MKGNCVGRLSNRRWAVSRTTRCPTDPSWVVDRLRYDSGRICTRMALCGVLVGQPCRLEEADILHDHTPGEGGCACGVANDDELFTVPVRPAAAKVDGIADRSRRATGAISGRCHLAEDAAETVTGQGGGGWGRGNTTQTHAAPNRCDTLTPLRRLLADSRKVVDRCTSARQYS